MHLSVFANYSEENFFFISQSVIFYAVRSPKLNQWLNSDIIQVQLQKVHQDPHYVEVDSNSFYHNIDEDYDLRHGGISKTSFLNCYFTWIQYCASRKDPVSLPFVWLLDCKQALRRALEAGREKGRSAWNYFSGIGISASKRPMRNADWRRWH